MLGIVILRAPRTRAQDDINFVWQFVSVLFAQGAQDHGSADGKASYGSEGGHQHEVGAAATDIAGNGDDGEDNS